MAVSQSEVLRVMPPEIDVLNQQGEWEKAASIGFPMGKDKTVIADLSGKFKSKNAKIRIRTNMQIYWDHIFYSACEADMEIETNEVYQLSAEIHYRGFSDSY